MPARRGLVTLTLAAALLAPALPALGQSREYRLDDGGGWEVVREPEPGSDEAFLNTARGLIADGRPSKARRVLDKWIRENEFGGNPWFAEALLVRGDAWVAKGDEHRALFDYERIAAEFPESPAFVRAAERELEIASAYVRGMKRKSFGLRYEDSRGIGEELLIRIQERLPGSVIAERALLELADYYYRIRDMESAAEAYEIFERNYPRSPRIKLAMERRIYSNVAQFKGPRYDASRLVEARLLSERFAARYPADAERTGVGDALRLRLDESSGEQRLATARWYIQRGDEVSAELTLRRLVAELPTTAAAAAGVELMQERGWWERDAAGDRP